MRSVAVFASSLLLLALGCSSDAPPGKGAAAPDGPTPAKEGVTWTHKELLAHLKAKGVEFRTRRPDVPEAEPATILYTTETIKGLGEGFLDMVRVVRKADAEAARAAGAALTDQGFSWGRFVFSLETTHDRAGLLGRLRKALAAD